MIIVYNIVGFNCSSKIIKIVNSFKMLASFVIYMYNVYVFNLVNTIISCKKFYFYKFLNPIDFKTNKGQQFNAI